MKEVPLYSCLQMRTPRLKGYRSFSYQAEEPEWESMFRTPRAAAGAGPSPRNYLIRTSRNLCFLAAVSYDQSLRTRPQCSEGRLPTFTEAITQKTRSVSDAEVSYFTKQAVTRPAVHKTSHPCKQRNPNPRVWRLKMMNFPNLGKF